VLYGPPVAVNQLLTTPSNLIALAFHMGRFLFEVNSTVVTRVTIGGTSAGMPIPMESVIMGELTSSDSEPASAGGRRLASEPNQCVPMS
jgi:hypothetical protein